MKYLLSVLCLFLLSCYSSNISNAENEVGDIVYIYYNSNEDIYGFQFNVSDANVTSASGGAAASSGFTVSTSASVVLGFSFTGSYIPAGSGLLTTLTVVGGEPCLSELVLAGAGGATLTSFIEDCTTIIVGDYNMMN